MTDTVTVSRELLRQVLEAVNSYPHRHLTPSIAATRVALRAALEQPAPVERTVQEPRANKLMRLWAPIAEVLLKDPHNDKMRMAFRRALDAEPTCKPPLQVHKPTGWVAPKNQYAVPVLFNPYTGEPRDVRDVQSDPQGILIVPPGKVAMLAYQPAPVQEPDAFLHDDGYWTAAKTDAGRALNDRLHFAGSTKVAVYTAQPSKAVKLSYQETMELVPIHLQHFTDGVLLQFIGAIEAAVLKANGWTE